MHKIVLLKFDQIKESTGRYYCKFNLIKTILQRFKIGKTVKLENDPQKVNDRKINTYTVYAR
jgi:hypothetical protein